MALGYSGFMGTIIGIDYGSKRIGIALADSSAGVAFPHSTLDNSADAVKAIAALCEQEKATLIILGESKNYAMEDNLIMKDARVFGDELAAATSLSLIYEPEFLTSHQATQTHQVLNGATNKQDGAIDASAAAVILQAYLDAVRSATTEPTSHTFHIDDIEQ